MFHTHMVLSFISFLVTEGVNIDEIQPHENQEPFYR